ncbi:MAG TPA: NAD-glutamate dehydrogenase, partial [Actinomycetales bacterium]|nr:NAD-glutamate dehydrogenase [Actinomycetales bacterium]
MSPTPEQTREAVLARAVEAGERHHSEEPDLASYLTRYYKHVPDEDLRQRDPVDLAGAALSQLHGAQQREPGKAKIRVLTPTVDDYGWQTGHTVVEIVTDDMPFLVDSVTSELSRQKRGIHVVVHPTFVVRRSITGELLELLDTSPSSVATGTRDPNWPSDAIVESWMHLEIDRESDPNHIEGIVRSLRKVLEDVRSAVEDWPKMQRRAGEIAEDLRAHPPAELEEEAAEAGRLLDWLAQDNFTFVGYREYDLV